MVVQDPSPEAKYRCIECNLQFGTPRDLSRHLNKTAKHGGPPSPCAICHKPLIRPESRARHERRCRERFGVTEEMWQAIERERERGRRKSTGADGLGDAVKLVGETGGSSGLACDTNNNNNHHPTPQGVGDSGSSCSRTVAISEDSGAAEPIAAFKSTHVAPSGTASNVVASRFVAQSGEPGSWTRRRSTSLHNPTAKDTPISGREHGESSPPSRANNKDPLELRTIEGNKSTSVLTGKHDTHRDSNLQLDKELTPYITANEAYAHILRMETPLQAAFATIGFSDEYILQVGFNEAALRESLLIEEIYLFLNGDLPTLNDQAVYEAFASVFTPFPGVVYTQKSIYYLPVDTPSHGFRHLSSLGGFNIRATSSGTSSGAGGGGTPGRDRSGKGDHHGKGKSREDQPEGGGGQEGGNDDGGNDPDPGEPSGGDNPRKSGFYITLKSTVSIKAGDTVSHYVTTRVDAVITVNRSVEDPGWPGPKIGVNLTTVAISCKTLIDQPAYMLSQAEIQMSGCSTQKIVLAKPNPLDVHLDGDTKIKTANKTSSGNIVLGFAAPHGPNVTTGVAMSKGQSMEQTAGRWEISFHELTSADHPTHLMDGTYSFVGGGYWQYIPNNEDFMPVKKAIFVDSLSPSGVFRMREQVPTKVEIKIISFWETQPRSISRWSTLFKINWRRSAEQIPAFANFICGVSTTVDLNLQKVTDRGLDRDILLPLDDDFKVELSEEPQRLKTVERVLDLEVPMLTAIMGRVSLLDKMEHHSQANILL